MRRRRRQRDEIAYFADAISHAVGRAVWRVAGSRGGLPTEEPQC